MKLADWIFTNTISPTQLRRMLGLSNRNTVHRYLNGERVPQPPVMQRIIEVTKGQVQLADFLDPAPPECAEVRLRPDGSAKWFFTWSRETTHHEHDAEHDTDDEHEDTVSLPVQRALDALGHRAHAHLNGTFSLDRRPVDIRALVRAANRELTTRGREPIRYPGVETDEDGGGQP